MIENEEKEKTYYQCRYYNDVFGLINDFKIPTSQTRNKILKLDFKNRVIELIEGESQYKKWPYKEKITIAVSISGLEPYINRIDIDNVLKNLLDVLKERVFVDDKQIFSIMAEKHVHVNHAFLIAIRGLKDNEFNKTIPPFFSPNKKMGLELED